MGGSLALMSEVLQLNKPGFEADLKRKKPYFPVTNGHILTLDNKIGLSSNCNSVGDKPIIWLIMSWLILMPKGGISRQTYN